MLRSCIKGFLRAKKLWVNPPKAERAKPSLSSDYNLLFKNKIGERSLDIHRLRGLTEQCNEFFGFYEIVFVSELFTVLFG